MLCHYAGSTKASIPIRKYCDRVGVDSMEKLKYDVLNSYNMICDGQMTLYCRVNYRFGQVSNCASQIC